MGERTVEEAWRRRVEELMERLKGKLEPEAVIVFGSWARSGGGEWSDVDILVVTPDVRDTAILDRFMLAEAIRPPRTQLFIYTFEELERMLRRMNPLALSALAEGIPVKLSKRVEKLMEEARRCYERRGRVWLRKC